MILAVAFLLSWLVEERPLRQSVETAGVGEAFATPSSGDSLHALVADWSPDEDPRLNDAIDRIAHELAREAPAPR